MRTSHVISAIAALVAGGALTSPSRADLTEISVGTFKNIGGGDIEYTGDFATYVQSGLEDGRTVIEIDLAGIAASLNYNALAGARLRDSRGNQYGTSSPGADLDLVQFNNLLASTSMSMLYDGPNAVHQEENEATLMQRIETLDAVSGDQDNTVLHFVSLGDAGTLTTMLSFLQPTSASSPLATGSDSFTSLRVSEHGFNESFEVFVFATNVPAPGVLMLFALNLLHRRRARLQ